MSTEKVSVLKAAITPESVASESDGSDLLAAVSTRRFNNTQKVKQSPLTTKAPGVSGLTERKRVQTDSVSSSKDFRLMRAQRDERIAAATTFRSSPIENSLPGVLIDALAVTVPRSIYEFEKRWNDQKDCSARVAMLQVSYCSFHSGQQSEEASFHSQ